MLMYFYKPLHFWDLLSQIKKERGFVSGKTKKLADTTQIFVYFDNKLLGSKKYCLFFLFQAGRATF